MAHDTVMSVIVEKLRDPGIQYFFLSYPHPPGPIIRSIQSCSFCNSAVGWQPELRELKTFVKECIAKIAKLKKKNVSLG